MILIFSTAAGHAQTKIRGSVVNAADHQGIPQANVTLTSSSGHYTTYTNDEGVFQQVLPAGSYQLEVHHVGYQLYAGNLDVKAGEGMLVDTIMLQGVPQQLDEVTVEGKRRLIEQKSDRMVIHVENSILASGMTALELLQRAPSVKVDEDGNINMRGKSDIGVLLNGKLSYLSPKELANVLKGTSSESIKSIELITNPSAKFDARGVGGLINIVMKDPASTPFSGSAQIFGGGGRKARYGAGANFQGQVGQWRWQGSFEHASRDEEEYRNFDRFYMDENNSYAGKSLQYSKTDEPLTTQQGSVGLEYAPSASMNLGLLYTGNFGNYRSFSNGYNDLYRTENERLTHTLTENSNDSRWQAHNVGFSYMQKIDEKKQLTADWDILYSRFDADQVLRSTIQQIGQSAAYLSARQIATPSTTRLQVAKIDYQQQVSDALTAELGWKSSWMQSDNSSLSDTLRSEVWIYDPQNSNHFMYKEQIHAAYMNVNFNLDKWGLIAGLRAERTQSSGELINESTAFDRQYTQLFPSVSVRYQPSNNHQLQLSYSRRINRPDYEDLNPFRYYIDAYVFWEGNPYLQPELANAYELNYTFYKNLHLSFYYTAVSNVMTSVLIQSPDQNRTIRSIHNIAGFQNYGLNANYSFSPFTFWSSQWNVNTFENRFFGSFRDERIYNKLWSYSLQTTNTYRLPKKWSAEWTAAYQSPQSDGVFRQKATGYVSLGLMKKMFEEKLNFKLAVDDLFKTNRYYTTSNAGNVFMDQRINLDSRIWRVSLGYSFGKSAEANSKKQSNQEQERVRGL
ncbi:TonB-dependent receptor domain-containing protein [Sphingobacterium deserti]|uniref:TonB-dependent receptor domain-containing protein n=1 Tax=Sphingobacterium deserti TaxID=1229276 RepID=UPI0005663DCB|nr:TonB-dependent receptor [Sphingobacterium deserti]